MGFGDLSRPRYDLNFVGEEGPPWASGRLFRPRYALQGRGEGRRSPWASWPSLGLVMPVVRERGDGCVPAWCMGEEKRRSTLGLEASLPPLLGP